MLRAIKIFCLPLLFPNRWLKHLLFPFLFFLGVNLLAQSNLSDQKISVTFNQVPLEQILFDISQKTGVQFSFNPKALPLEQKVSYKANNKTLDKILTDLFSQVNIQYDFVENHLVLKPIKESEIAQKSPTEELKTNCTISGYISDATNQEALIGATVFIAKSGLGTTTNNYGFFSFTLPAGNYTFQTSYLGYGSCSKQVELFNNLRWDIPLKPIASMVEEIIVSTPERELLFSDRLAAQTSIKAFDIKKQTAALGESDLLKSLDYLPGISFQSDGSSYFYVRGGNRDQNLILLDEAPIYNPSHMLGLFTPIIPDAVKSTQIYKADFPIQFGGRLSSLIDIRTRDGNMEKFGGSASFGIVTGRISLEGPIVKQKSSYFLSMRRSYFGAFLKAAQPNITDFYFSDFTSKLNFRLAKKDRLFLTFYKGKDKFINEETQKSINGLEWGNTSLTLRWNHLFSERLFVNTTFYSSRYDYYLHTDYSNHLYWNSHISSAHVKSEFSYFANPSHQINYGIKLGAYYFNPGNHNAPGISMQNTVSPNNSAEFTVYAGHEWKMLEWLNLKYGFRFTNWSNYGEAFVLTYVNYQPVDYHSYKKGERYYTNNSWEPRVSLSFKIGEFASLKASYNKTLQHINLINNSISPFNSLEVWLPSGPNIKPQHAHIYNLGFVDSWIDHSVEFSVDIFLKQLENQIGYAYHASTLLNPLLEGELRQGDGTAYGFELQLKKTLGRLTGQIAYAFTRSLLQIDGLNGNRAYKARQDKPIDFSAGLGYFIKPRVLASVSFSYSSGMKITTPTSFYFYRGTQIPVYTLQNNDRLPNYKRLDLSCDFKLNKSDGNFEHHLVLSIYNFLNNKNPAFLYFTKTSDAQGEFIIPTDKLNLQSLVPTYRYIYSIIPTFTYTLNF